MINTKQLDEIFKNSNIKPVTQATGGSWYDQLDINKKKSSTGLDNAPFQANGDENVLQGTAKAVGNLPRSTFELGKNIASAATHPKRTINAVVDITKGLGAKVAESFLANTDFGQSILQRSKERGVPIETDENGKLQATNTPELEKFNGLMSFFKDRYGSMDKFKETAIEDPAGVLADIASVVSGAGAVVKTAGTVSKVADIANVGSKIAEIGNKIEPVSIITSTGGKVKNAVTSSKTAQTVGNIVSDISPTAYKMQQGQVVKALGISKGKLKNISDLNGNDPVDFIINNNLLKETPEATKTALPELRKNIMTEVRNEISKVDTIYNLADVPNVKKGLDVILKGVDEVPGLENVADEIRTFSQKSELSLSDIQRAKELLDENSNIYSKIGDVNSSAQARGLDNIRKSLKTFIEDEVTKATNGQTNIKQLNNDVQTTHAIEDAIDVSYGLSKSHLSAFDLMIGLGGTAAFSPLVGVGIVIGKKVAESPAFRLAFAKLLQKKPIAFVQNLSKELSNKAISANNKIILKNMIESAKKNAQFIESGLASISGQNQP